MQRFRKLTQFAIAFFSFFFWVSFASSQQAGPAPTPKKSVSPAAPAPSNQSKPAPQHVSNPALITGVYYGSFTCANPDYDGKLKIALSVTPKTDATGTLAGVVTFDARGSSGPQPATLSVQGSTAADTMIARFAKWETAAPARSLVAGKTGSSFDANAPFGFRGSYSETDDAVSGLLAGTVVNPTCHFSAQRDAGESAQIDEVIAAQKAGTASTTPPPPPPVQMAAPAPASSVAASLAASSQSAAAGSIAASAAGCATQAAAGQASAPSTGTSALSNIGSIFGHKKAPAKAAPVANEAAGCEPAASTTAVAQGSSTTKVATGLAMHAATMMVPGTGLMTSMTGATGAVPAAGCAGAALAGQGTAGAAVSAAANATSAMSSIGSILGAKKTPQKVAQVANAAAGCNAAVNASAAATRTVAGSAAAAALASNSSPAASPATMSSSAAAQPTSSPAQPQGAGSVYSPPSSAPAAFAGPPDPSKLPDISGLHLGMSLDDAKAALQKLYPNARIDALNGGGLGPRNIPAVGFYRVEGGNTGHNQAGVDFTAPPNPQLVWHMSRNTPQPHVAHNVLVAALRQKYGKETYATANTGVPAPNDSEILQMWWLFDERGQLVPSAKIISGSPFGCGNGASTNTTTGTPFDYYRSMMAKETGGLSTFCASSYVGVLATISNQPIVDNLTLDMVDLPLVVRSAKASDAWSKAEFEKARQQDIQRSNQVKPAL